MEASGTPTPGPSSAQPPPPPPTIADEEKATGVWRALGIVLALALAFACAVMVIAMADIGETPTCDDILSGEAALPDDGECFDGSSAQKTASLVLGWPSGVLAGVATLFAFYFVIRGRQGRLVLQLTAGAIVLGAASILVGSI